MRHAKPVRLETTSTGLPFGRHCFQLCLCGAVRNRTYRGGVNAARLETTPTGLPFGRHCFQLCLCGAIGNHTYRGGVNAVRLETAPTGPDKSGSKPRGESVYLFLVFTNDLSPHHITDIRFGDIADLTLLQTCAHDSNDCATPVSTSLKVGQQ